MWDIHAIEYKKARECPLDSCLPLGSASDQDQKDHPLTEKQVHHYYADHLPHIRTINMKFSLVAAALAGSTLAAPTIQQANNNHHHQEREVDSNPVYGLVRRSQEIGNPHAVEKRQGDLLSGLPSGLLGSGGPSGLLRDDSFGEGVPIVGDLKSAGSIAGVTDAVSGVTGGLASGKGAKGVENTHAVEKRDLFDRIRDSFGEPRNSGVGARAIDGGLGKRQYDLLSAILSSQSSASSLGGLYYGILAYLASIYGNVGGGDQSALDTLALLSALSALGSGSAKSTPGVPVPPAPVPQIAVDPIPAPSTPPTSGVKPVAILKENEKPKEGGKQEEEEEKGKEEKKD
jgi:hypothetical protein